MSPPFLLSEREWADAQGEATALLQGLIRVDTSNPPGNERPAADLLAASLRADGLEPRILESAPERANVVCRIRSTHPERPALLLTGHLDVVPAGDPARWTHPPFSGALADGWIWGRGALDMKNMVAMSAMTLKLLARRGIPLERDLILAAVADEEQACEHGSRFLVEQHPEEVRAGFALGESGGWAALAGRVPFVPIQTAEKGVCWLRATARGEAGHGSMPIRDSAPARLAEALVRLQRRRLPQHVTPVVEHFLGESARLQGLPMRFGLGLLLDPRLGPTIARLVIRDPDQARMAWTLLHNTVSPTVLRAGEKTNVIPGEASAELDGRLLPGQTPDDLLRELREVTGDLVAYEILHTEPGMVNHPPGSPVWDAIVDVIRSRTGGLPVLPFLNPGVSDAHQFARLGARWYGFTPIGVDPHAGFRPAELYHNHDERIPEDGFHWGLRTLVEVVTRVVAPAAAH